MDLWSIWTSKFIKGRGNLIAEPFDWSLKKGFSTREKDISDPFKSKSIVLKFKITF